VGQRKGQDGKPIPRKIINKFVAEFDRQTVYQRGLDPAIVANPYMQFLRNVEESARSSSPGPTTSGTVPARGRKDHRGWTNRSAPRTVRTANNTIVFWSIE